MEKKVDEFVEYVSKVKKGSKNTVDSYRRDLKKMVVFFRKQLIESIEKVNETNINSYMLSLEKEGKSAATITRNVSSMKMFFHYMLVKGYVKSEPTEMITPPKVEKKNVGVNSINSIERLLNQPKGKTPKELRDKAMLELLYATGMRVSEIVDVELSDVNLTMEYVICKNGKKERIIPFGKKAKQALSRYLKSGRIELLKEMESDFLFVNCHGGKLSRQGFWKILKEYAEEAGIEEEITPHTLRHSFGAHLVANGADLKAVKEMMGHVDLASTQVYLNVESSSIRDVYSKTHPRI